MEKDAVSSGLNFEPRQAHDQGEILVATKLNEILLDVADLTRRTPATNHVTGPDYRQGHIYDRLVR